MIFFGNNLYRNILQIFFQILLWGTQGWYNFSKILSKIKCFIQHTRYKFLLIFFSIFLLA